MSEPFEMVVSSLLLKLFVCLCACENLSFTMTNGIVFHTYDSLLQLFHCVNHLRPKSCVPWLGSRLSSASCAFVQVGNDKGEKDRTKSNGVFIRC